jgi:hypothetical protein
MTDQTKTTDMSVERIARRTRDMSVERIARNDAIFREANERIREFAETSDIETPLLFISTKESTSLPTADSFQH